MGSIAWNRVFLGGIVAGLIIDLVEWLFNGMLLGAEWRQAMQALGRPMVESTGNMLFYVVLGFGYGIGAVAMYAAIRPRFSPGPITALYAGLGVWVLGYFLPTLMWAPMELFPKRLVASALLIGLAEILIATFAGAWLYQEAGPGAEATARRAA
jgi:hypothetical protein